MFRFAAAAAVSVVALATQSGTIGVFDGHTDVGQPAIAGSAAYDAAAQTYTITGAGVNMWGARDELHFVWKRLKGDFTLDADAAFPREGAEAHRKFGLIVRSTLDPASPYVDAAVHGDGLTALQFRRTAGGDTQEIRSTATAPGRVQLERRGRTYTMSVGRAGEPLTPTVLDDLDLGDEVYAGLFVCSHNPKVSETAVFRNVRIETASR